MKWVVFTFLLFALVVLSFIGCAGQRVVMQVPEIQAGQLLDSLVARDTLVQSIYITGKGKFIAQDKDERFFATIMARRPDKLYVRIAGPLGITTAILWLCGNDSLCIYIPSKGTVLVEPLGADIPDVILPPSTPVMLDMFCGIAPIARFADSLQNFEKASEGYYLTFKRGNEVLVALAKPNPWHISEFQWVKTTNTNEQVDVKFTDGEITEEIWRPGKIEITAPALAQKISISIKKELINPALDDTMFIPKLPKGVKWQSAF